MNYRIEQKEAFEVFGVVGTIEADNQEKAFIEVPKFCIECDDNGSVDRINALLGRNPDTMLHAALFDYTENSFKYMICEYVTNNMSISKEYERLSVPALTWVIFPSDDCDIPGIWRRIYTEWLQTFIFAYFRVAHPLKYHLCVFR